MPDPVETPHQARIGPALKRRRAARACLSCRSRKVRCDVSRSGPPCMNCSLDAIDCVVKARKPKSSARHGSQVDSREVQHSSASPEHVDGQMPETSSQQVDATDCGAILETAEATQQLAAHNGTFDHGTIEDQVMDLIFPQDAGFTVEQQTSLNYGPPAYSEPAPLLQDDWMAEGFRENDTGHVDMNRVDVPCTQRRRTTHKNSVVYTYYPFLTLNNLYNCLPHDVDFLEAEGCFHLPTRKIMDQIVRQYFLHVHPLLPILNEGDFWDMYHSKRPHGSSNMSLLVIQAMMFVACNLTKEGRKFVNWSPESTRSVGYKNTRGLRATFYRRAKLLYDFGAESSPVAIAQASLLLSYWVPPVGTELRSNTVWLSIAIENAKNADAPYYATLPAPQRAGTSPDQRAEAKHNNLLKRLWWCCVIRDRILPLGLRRGIQITRAHFDFAAHPPLGLMDLDDEVHRSVVYGADAKRELIRVLSHVLDLCVILTDVLLLVFPLDGALSARGRAAVLPLKEANIRSNKKALVHWYTAAVATSATDAGAGERSEVSWNRHDSVILYTHLMFTYYHSARMALYNHELQHYLALVAENSPVDTHKLMETRDAIQNACSNITENIRGLNQRHLTRWLPISMAAYVAFPLALHVLNTHLSAHQTPSSGTLIEVMMTMHAQYDGVHWVAKLVRHLVALVQADAAGGRAVASWAELLTFKPRTYLRLALAMDLSMSSGRIPDKRDFPAQLEMKVLRELAGPRAGAMRAGGARGEAAALAVEDSALSADFFDVDFSDSSFGAQDQQNLDSVAAGTEEAVVGAKTVSEDSSEQDRSQQGNPGDEENAQIEDGPVQGGMIDEMDTFFDPVLADLEGGEDSSATDDGLRAFGSGFEDSTVLTV